MQNRNRSQNNPSQLSILDQAYARARASLGAEHPPIEPAPAPIGNPAGTDERTVDQLLDSAELLRVLREPVEWILALALQLTGGDPVDVAAVARLRAAFHARLQGRPTGIRPTDLLIVSGLLVGALDPSVVVRAVSDTLGDGLSAVLGSSTPTALEVAGTGDPLTALLELLAALRPKRSGGPPRACSVRCTTHSHPVR